MRYPEDFERSCLISRNALEAMSKHQIPLNPDNYAVWYSYASGSSPKLKKTIKILLSNDAAFTPERNDEIYEEFLAASGSAQVVGAAGSKIQDCAEEIIQALSQASADQGGFGKKVESLSKNLSGASNPAEIGEFVRGILVETQSILANSKTLELKLTNSTKEIETLRESLRDVQEEALTDALTGIANRKCFDQSLRRDATDAMEKGTPLCLLLLDIDHFKKFNDSHGHAVGDSVLKVVAGQLKQSVKGQDLPARYGGEEFCILLPRTELKNAAKLAEKIRAELAARQLKDSKSDKTYGSITLSIGAAEYQLGENLASFVARTDMALYRAKQTGRNRVAVAVPTESQLEEAG